MKLQITFILLLNSILAFGQIEFEAKELAVINEVEGKLTIESYENIFLYKGKKCKFSINTVEKQFCDFFNLSTQQQLEDFFKPYEIPTSYKKEDYLKNMRLYDDNKNNYYQLDSKYIFNNGITEDIFVKYINYNGTFPKPIYSVFYIQSSSQGLIVKDMGENLDIALFLVGTNTTKVSDYLKNEKNINITKLCDDFFNCIKNDDSSNINVFNLLDKQFSPFYKKEIAKTGEMSKNTRGTPIKNSLKYKKEFHDVISGVVLKKQVLSKEKISEKYRIPIELLKRDSLAVKEIIDINSSNDTFSILKFYDNDPIIKKGNQILDRDIAKGNNTLFVLTTIDFDVFVDICFSEKPKYPKFQKFKKVIEKEGNIMIRNLRDIIEENKNAFM